jgi:hypothetical protein
MNRLLVSAFIAFGVLIVIFMPRQAPEDALAETVFMRACQKDFGPRTHLSAAQVGQLCRCAAPRVLKTMGSVQFLKGKQDEPWTTQEEAQLRSALQTCVAPFENANRKR